MGRVLLIRIHNNNDYCFDFVNGCMVNRCVAMILKIIQRIFQVFTILMSLIIIYMLILKLTGHSPTVEDVLLAFVVTQFTLFIGFAIQSALFQGKVVEFMSNTRNELKYLRQKVDKNS